MRPRAIGIAFASALAAAAPAHAEGDVAVTVRRGDLVVIADDSDNEFDLGETGLGAGASASRPPRAPR